MRKLNPYRVSDWSDAYTQSVVERLRGNRERAARWLRIAGIIRANASKQWDFEVMKWVCQCCILVLANGECCADDGHGGDYMTPLGLAKDTDSWVPGGEHDDRCTEADREAGCDCHTRDFDRDQCDGCGSWLAGDRHRVTVFVNDRRKAPVSV